MSLKINLKKLENLIGKLSKQVKKETLEDKIKDYLSKFYEEKETCSICVNEYEDNKYNLNCCNNTICRNCLLNIFTCPFCRADINEPHTIKYRIETYIKEQFQQGKAAITIYNVLLEKYDAMDIKCIFHYKYDIDIDEVIIMDKINNIIDTIYKYPYFQHHIIYIMIFINMKN